MLEFEVVSSLTLPRSRLKNRDRFDPGLSNKVCAAGFGGVTKRFCRRLLIIGEMNNVELCCDGVFWFWTILLISRYIVNQQEGLLVINVIVILSASMTI